VAAPTRASEELLAAPLPAMVRDLGLAVAVANKELREADSDIRYTIPSAEIEVKIAISVTQAKETTVGGSLNVHAFNVNASYKSTFGFSEEASSTIKLTLVAMPKPDEAPGQKINP